MVNEATESAKMMVEIGVGRRGKSIIMLNRKTVSKMRQ